MSRLRASNNKFLNSKAKSAFKGSYAECRSKGLNQGYRKPFATVCGTRIRINSGPIHNK